MTLYGHGPLFFEDGHRVFPKAIDPRPAGNDQRLWRVRVRLDLVVFLFRDEFQGIRLRGIIRRVRVDEPDRVVDPKQTVRDRIFFAL